MNGSRIDIAVKTAVGVLVPFVLAGGGFVVGLERRVDAGERTDVAIESRMVTTSDLTTITRELAGKVSREELRDDLAEIKTLIAELRSEVRQLR